MTDWSMFAGGGFNSGMTDDYGQPLDTSVSPGLPTLPAQGQPSDFAAPMAPAGPGISGGDPMGNMSEGAAPGPSALNTPAAPSGTTSGLGLADYKKKRHADDTEYLESLPTAQKIGLLLQSFSAGVRGDASPIDTLLANRQKRETEFRNELGTVLKATTTGIDAIKKVPPGKARDAMIEQIVRATGGDPMVKDALMAVGTAQEDTVKDVVSAISNPSVQAMLTKASGGDSQKARVLLADKDFMDRAFQQADSDNMPGLLGKVKFISKAMAQMPQYKGKDGRASFTMSDLTEQNDKLAPEFKLSDAEMAAARRNEIPLIMYGLKPDSAVKKQAEFEAAAPEREAEKIKDEARRKANKKEMIDYARAGKDAPAPTVVEIDDPKNPGKTIKIDARTQEKIGDSPSKSSGKALPSPLQKQLTEAAEMADATVRFSTTFKKEFGGKTITGGAGNVAGKIFGDETGQTQWWQDYELHQSQVRNKLFGSALTATEATAWEKSAISPRMDSGEIKKNLDRRTELEEKALGKLIKGASAGGYNKEQIEAYTGRSSSDGKPAASKFVEGKVYQDANGNKAKYVGGKWVPQ